MYAECPIALGRQAYHGVCAVGAVQALQSFGHGSLFVHTTMDSRHCIPNTHEDNTSSVGHRSVQQYKSRRAHKNESPRTDCNTNQRMRSPSGATKDHYRVLLDDEESTQLFVDAMHLLAQANVLADVLAGLRIGRLVALRKSSGRVRGLVMSDVLRRFAASALAKHFMRHFKFACAPHQFALSARAGTESYLDLASSFCCCCFFIVLIHPAGPFTAQQVQQSSGATIEVAE